MYNVIKPFSVKSRPLVVAAMLLMLAVAGVCGMKAPASQPASSGISSTLGSGVNYGAVAGGIMIVGGAMLGQPELVGAGIFLLATAPNTY